MYQHWRLLTCQLNEIYMTVKFSKLRSQYPWSFDCETAPSTVRAATVLNYNFPISSQTKTVAKKTIIFNPIVQFLAFDCHIKCAPLLLRWRIRGDFYGFDGNRATFCNALCQEYSSHFLAISETIFAANILTGAKPQLSHLSQYRQRQKWKLTLWCPLLPYGDSYKAFCARPGQAVICNHWHVGTLMLRVNVKGLTTAMTCGHSDAQG